MNAKRCTFLGTKQLFVFCLLFATWGRNYAAGVDPVGAPLSLSQLPRPFIIAHRGSPHLYPEHTLEAYRASVKDGNAFVEVDCFLLADGSVGVMHDETLERTTTGRGRTEKQTADSWRQLQVDGSRIVGGKYGKQKVPMLRDVLTEFVNKTILVIEPKNRNSGAAVVKLLQEQQASPDRVLINSFLLDELQPAIAAGYPVCFNLAQEKNAPRPATIVGKGIAYLCVNKGFSKEYVQEAKRHGFIVLASTVNRQYEFIELLGKGIDGVYSDDPLYLSGVGYQRDRDPYTDRTWYHGEIVTLRGTRGGFYPPDKWGLSEASSEAFAGVLQGWCSPLNAGTAYTVLDLNLTVAISRAYTSKHGAMVILSSADVDWDDKGKPVRPVRGYVFRIGLDGSLQIERYNNGLLPETVARANGSPFCKDTPFDFRITLRDGWWSLTNMNTSDGVIYHAADSGLTPSYLTFGVHGAAAQFSRINVAVR